MPAIDQWHGILPVDKPSGVTSHDVVAHVRRIIGQQGVGHTGTLDPRATGLLILCLGRATKVVQFISNFDKTYVAEIRLGRTSTTYDAEGIDQTHPSAPVPVLNEEMLTQLLSRYIGKFTQQVPIYSAVKVHGVPLHRSARSGIPVEAPEREVEITAIRLLSYDAPNVRFELTCAKGTYVRSIAHDMGQRLGCGAYLSELRRTHVGSFSVADAYTIRELESRAKSRRLGSIVLPVEKVLTFAALHVTENFSKQVVNGRALKKPDLVSVEGDFHAGDQVVLKDTSGMILAVGTAVVDAGDIGSDPRKSLFNYLRVLN
jgi:tRNA pseudouridine55 synthase